eukprot:4277999-Pleurochrysis_carterae.AAC.2
MCNAATEQLYGSSWLPQAKSGHYFAILQCEKAQHCLRHWVCTPMAPRSMPEMRNIVRCAEVGCLDLLRKSGA